MYFQVRKIISAISNTKEFCISFKNLGRFAMVGNKDSSAVVTTQKTKATSGQRPPNKSKEIREHTRKKTIETY